MKIVWHTIPEFPEYEINRLGQIRRKSSGRVLKPFDDRRGYLRVSLNGRNVKVHLLVAKMFVPNPHGYPVVDHKHGDKHDNRASDFLAGSSEEHVDFDETHSDSVATYKVSPLEALTKLEAELDRTQARKVKVLSELEKIRIARERLDLERKRLDGESDQSKLAKAWIAAVTGEAITNEEPNGDDYDGID